MLTLFVAVFNVVTIAYGFICHRHVRDLGAPWSSGLADYFYNCDQNSEFLPFMLHLSASSLTQRPVIAAVRRSLTVTSGAALQRGAETVASACAACAVLAAVRNYADPLCGHGEHHGPLHASGSSCSLHNSRGRPVGAAAVAALRFGVLRAKTGRGESRGRPSRPAKRPEGAGTARLLARSPPGRRAACGCQHGGARRAAAGGRDDGGCSAACCCCAS